MKIEDMQTQAVNNAAVIQLFIMGQPGHAANLSTDGAVLRSYHYYELAIWATKDKVILRAGELYSKTTKKHMGLLKKALDRAKVEYSASEIDTPQDEKQMRFTPSRAVEVEAEPDPIELEIRECFARMDCRLACVQPFTGESRFMALSQYGYCLKDNFASLEGAEQYTLDYYRENINLIRQGGNNGAVR